MSLVKGLVSKITTRFIRLVYWLLLTGFVTGVVLSRLDHIRSATLTELDRGLLVLLALLLLLPVVSEFEGFGFKLRSELAETKRALGELRMQFQSLSVQLGARADAKVFVTLPTTLKEVEEVEQSIKHQIGRRLDDRSIGLDRLLASIPEPEKELAVIRQVVEREVWRIWRARRTVQPSLATGTPSGPQTAEQAAQELMDQDKLPKELGRAAQMVMWFAGPTPPVDHPDLPRDAQLKFVRAIGWTIVQGLQNLT